MSKKFFVIIISTLLMNLFLYNVSFEAKVVSYEARFKVPYADYLVDVARDTWRGISHFMCNETGLPFDRSDPGRPETSLTNIALYLASVVAAYDLGLINREEAVQRSNTTLSSLLKLKTWFGFPREWMDAITLQTSGSLTTYVSTVSLGPLAAATITARAAFPELKDKSDQLLAPMNWSKLYDPQKGLMYTWFDVYSKVYSGDYYVDLSSENRMSSFIAIGMGQVPASHWQKLSREMETREGIQYLYGWRYGLFVQFLPGIFIDERCSFIGRSAANLTRAQMLFAQRNNYPVWGFSYSDIPGGGYGLTNNVVTPHASVLAISYYPSEVIENMRELEEMGVSPEGYGFRDSVNVVSGEVDDSYLVLDQGMLFLSLANYLNGTIWRYFNSDSIAKNAKQLISDYQISDEAKQSYRTVFEDATTAVLAAEREGVNVTSYLSSLMEAKMLYNAGKYTQAVSIAEDIMQAEPISVGEILWNAGLYIQVIADERFNVTLAETLLIDARAAFNVGNYAGATTLAEEATLIAQKSKNATIAINGAEEAIEKAEMENRTQGLDQARERLEQARMQYNSGNYDEAKNLANQAKNLANQAEIPEQAATPKWPKYLTVATAGLILVIVCAVGIFYYLKKRKQ